MIPIKFLVLDGDSDSPSGNDLREILSHHRGGPEGIVYQTCREPEKQRRLLRELVTEIDPSVVCLIFGGEMLISSADLVGIVRGAKASPFCIGVVNTSDTEEVVKLLRLGFDSLLIPPLSAVTVLPQIWHVLNNNGTNSHRELQSAVAKAKGLIGRSPSFLASIKDLPKIARTNATLLIEGETGTGKEICARATHYLSDRTGKPFVALNCGSLRGELIENELFGHERGAYTGATDRALGAVRQAEGGSLFLDEIQTLSGVAQCALLRFLQEKEVRPLGGPAKGLAANVRVIAACNTRLIEAVRAGHFREDLYHRLHVLVIELPALRNRCEDIAPLAEHFLANFAPEYRSPARGFTRPAMSKLECYSWPGNVRELENVIRRAVLLSDHRCIGPEALHLEIQPETQAPKSMQEEKRIRMAEFDKEYVRRMLIRCNGNVTRAAEASGKDRRVFGRLIQKYGILPTPRAP